jgi:hypothetical protein
MATPASSWTKKRTLVNFFGAIKKPKLTSKALRYAPVILLYKGYLVSQADAQDDNLENLTKLCRRFNWIPTIDLVNNIIRETNIIDEKHRLNFPVYAFMQEFKFTMCVPYTTEQSRLLVGMLPVEGGVQLEVWAGWPGTIEHPGGTTTAAQTVLYNAAQAREGASKLEFHPEVREQIIWDKPLEELFEISKISKGKTLKSTVQVQNTILLSVAKVVLRFPGLLRGAPGTQDRLAISGAAGHPEYSQRPFTSSKVAVKTPEPKNPYSEALDILNSGPSPADDVHRGHPPDQQLIPGNKATENNINALKRKRVGTE